MRKIYYILPLIILTLSMMALSAIGQIQGENMAPSPPTILHNPIIRADEGEAVEIEATITDQDDDVQSTFLYYRSSGDENFDYVEMLRNGDMFTEDIPATVITQKGVEYYLETIDGQGNIVTSPSVNAFENPHRIEVTAGVVSLAPEITILSPEANSTVKPTDGVIIVSFYDAQSDIDPRSIRIWLDGTEVTSQATITPSILSFVPGNVLESGLHKVEIEVGDNAGHQAAPAKWYFEAAEKPIKRKIFTATGKIKLYSKYDNVSGDGKDRRNEPQWTNRLDGEVRGDAKFVSYHGKIHLTSDEDSKAQPRNRFYFDLSNSFATVKAGDVNPDFSSLTVNRQRIRGFETVLRLKHLNITYFQGEGVRPIEERGIYSRKMAGVRAEVLSGKTFAWGTNFVKAKDDTASIEKYGQSSYKAQDNAVVSSDMALNFGNGFLTVKGEAAASLITENLYNKDISEDLPDWVEDTFSQIIDINSSTLKPSINSMAFKADLSNRVKANTFSANFRSIGPVYKTAVNPSLQTDQLGFGVSDRLRLWQNKLMLGLDFDRYEDNLAGNDKETTTTTTALNTSVNFRYSSAVPDLKLSFRTFSRIGEDSDLINNQTNTLTLGTMYSFSFWQLRNMINLNFVQTNFSDDVYSQSDFDNISFLFGYSSRFEIPLTLSLGIGYNQSKGQIVTTTFNTFALRGAYKFLDEKLTTKVSTTLIMGSRDDDQLSSGKMDFEVGADYNWAKTRVLGMALGMVNYSDDDNPETDFSESILKAHFTQKF